MRDAHPPEPRRYDEGEVRRILDRAAAGQERAEAGRSAERRGDPTLAELRSIAEEAGIDPRHVDAAALELYGSTAPSVAISPLPNWSIREARSLPGVTLTDRTFEAVVGELRRTFASNGSVTDFGHAREWATTSLDGSQGARIRIEEGDDGTTFVLTRDVESLRSMPMVLGTSFVAIGVIVGILLMITGNAADSALMALAWFGAAGVTFLGGGWLGRRTFERRSRDLQDTAETVAGLLRD